MVTGEGMSEEGTFFGRLWAKQHGNQFGISAVAAGSSGVVLVACMYQLLFLQDHAEWNDYTGGAIIGAVVSLIVFLVSFPEFLRFRGYVNVLEEIMDVQSTPEIRRRKAEGDEAAEALGAGHLEHWNAFLDSKGVKR
ncbi:MAG TPA: hypothetical protein D7I08_06270 [Candidatus Poseidoniales archaeon]|nr:MAG TPA: hypothetical protein D7I08_06270 [Candidatus Poseidoniales archaeon]